MPSDWMRRLLAAISFLTSPIFVVATLTYGMATLAFYHPNNDDSYKAWFLMGGILVAIVLGL